MKKHTKLTNTYIPVVFAMSTRDAGFGGWAGSAVGHAGAQKLNSNFLFFSPPTIPPESFGISLYSDFTCCVN